MFWDEGAAALNSLQQLLLDTKGDVELSRVLEDEYVLQESRQGNQDLMAVLTKDENLEELTKNCLCPDLDPQLPVEQQYTLSNLSAEILTVAGHNHIVDAFFKNKKCMEMLGAVLDDTAKFNPVVAIFYTKLMSALWSKNFAATMTFVKQTQFLEKSRGFLRYGAIADLLESLIRLNSDEANIVELKQYLVTEQFLPKIVALLDPQLDPAMHENAADVYVDILRNLREVLVVNDDKTDALHDVFLSETLINEILERMLSKVDAKDEPISQQQQASLVRNGYAMISALCEQNALCPTPSQLFDVGETDPQQLPNWSGGGPGEGNFIFDRTRMWLPDKEKVAELAAAKRSADIVRALIEDVDREETGNSWPWLLKLLNELVDTNHLPTHRILVEGFRETGFQKLFELVYRHPMVHIYHHQLRNIVTFALFSDFSKTPAVSEELSPLVEFFVKECDLFARLKTGVWPAENLSKMKMISIRSFHIYMADSFTKAGKWAPCRKAINEIVEKSEAWMGDSELSIEKGLEAYWEKNRSDLHLMKASSSESASTAANQNCELFDDDDEVETIVLNCLNKLSELAANDAVYDIETFSRFECATEFPDFDTPSSLHSVLHNFSAKKQDEEDVDIDLRSRDAREDDFDHVDQFRPLADLFPDLKPRTAKIVKKRAVDGSWPGENTTATSPTAMDTSNGPSTDEWDAFATGRLSNGSNSSTDEWNSLPAATQPNNNPRGSFDGMDFEQHCQEAMSSLEASVKSDEQTTDPVWDNDTLTSDQWNPFPETQTKEKEHPALNESEA